MPAIWRRNFNVILLSRSSYEDIHWNISNMHFSWSNIWLESRSVFWNFLFINSYGLKAERSNREVRNIRVSDLMLVGLIILEISLFIKSWKKIKQEDPLKEIKEDLLIIKFQIYGFINLLIFLRVIVYFGI